MAVGYLLCALLLAVTTSLTSSQGNNSIRTGITVVPDAARVIAQKSSPLLLNCSVIVDSDVGDVSFRWRKNGKLLPTLDSNRIQVLQNGSLYFKRVIHKTGRRRNKKRSDQGVYECLLHTQYGEAIIRRVYVLIPSIGKRFSQDPAPFTAFEGGVARFQCGITGIPPPIILWKKGTRGGQDDNFLESNTSKYVQLPHGVLHIRRVTREDEGEYRCLASRGGLINLPDVIDKIEWKDSQAASLTVSPAPAQRSPKVLAAPKNLTLELRSSGVMECLVDGQPMPTTEWTREGGGPIAANHVTEPGLLRFNLVKETDAGKYTCSVPQLGISLTATLTINKPPMLVEKGPSSQQWAIMRTVRFECDVSGTPKPLISWYHNGTKITDGMSKITIKAKQLIIRHTGENDSGYYQCIAENSVGSINLLARLNVYIKEGMPETPQNLTGVAESSTSISLKWYQPQQANSEPILTNTIWFAHDAKSLRSQFVNGEGPHFSFTLTGLEPYTVYTVFIRSFNKVGASDSSQSIQVQTLEEVPMAAPKLNLSSPTPDTLRVTWEELSREESRGRVVSYRVFYKQLPHGPQVRADTVPASQRDYLITGLEPETDYGVRVEAATKLGFSDFVPEEAQWQLFKTGNKLGSVRDVVVEPVNSSAVRIQWQPGTGEEDVAIYSIELFGRRQGETTSLRTLEVAAPRTNVLLTGLDNATQYLVSIEAKSGQYRSKPAKEEFQTSALLPPVELRAERLSPSSLWVAWQQPPGIRASAYTVCYLAQAAFTATAPTSQWTCFESRMLNATVNNLQPFTKYVFSISAHAGKLRSPGSDFLNVQTLEDVPSPPEKVSWNVVSRGTIELQWQPPTSPNGVITSYIILYNPDEHTPETTWKNITQTGEQTRAKVGDLTATIYYFKLRACTRAGTGSPSPVVKVNPDCPATQHPCPAEDNNASLFGLVFGVVVGMVIVVICLIIICLRIKHKRRFPEAEAQHYHGNGHAGGGKGANGHVRGGEVGSRLAIALQDLDSLAPMLTKLPENEQSDAKGGGNMIVTPNGVKVNGLLKCYQNNQVLNGHLTQYPSCVPPYCDTQEETHRLIDMMLASTDGSLTGDGSDCAGASSIITTERDSLEDIDRSHDDTNEDLARGVEGEEEEEEGSGGRDGGSTLDPGLTSRADDSWCSSTPTSTPTPTPSPSPTTPTLSLRGVSPGKSGMASAGGRKVPPITPHNSSWPLSLGARQEGEPEEEEGKEREVKDSRESTAEPKIPAGSGWRGKQREEEGEEEEEGGRGGVVLPTQSSNSAQVHAATSKTPQEESSGTDCGSDGRHGSSSGEQSWRSSAPQCVVSPSESVPQAKVQNGSVPRGKQEGSLRV